MARPLYYVALFCSICVLVSSRELRTKRDLQYIKNLFNGVFESTTTNCPSLKKWKPETKTRYKDLNYYNQLLLKDIPVGVDILPYLTNPQHPMYTKKINNRVDKPDSNTNKIHPLTSILNFFRKASNSMKNKEPLKVTEKKINSYDKKINSVVKSFNVGSNKRAKKINKVSPVKHKKVTNHVTTTQTSITDSFKYVSDKNANTKTKYNDKILIQKKNDNIPNIYTNNITLLKNKDDFMTTNMYSNDSMKLTDAIRKDESNMNNQAILQNNNVVKSFDFSSNIHTNKINKVSPAKHKKITNSFTTTRINLTYPLEYVYDNKNNTRTKDTDEIFIQQKNVVNMPNIDTKNITLLKNQDDFSTTNMDSNDSMKLDNAFRKDESNQTILIKTQEPVNIKSLPIKYSYKQKYLNINKTIETVNEGNLVVTKVKDYNLTKTDSHENVKSNNINFNKTHGNAQANGENLKISVFKEPYVYNSRYLYKQRNSNQPNKFTIVEVSDIQEQYDALTNPPQTYYTNESGQIDEVTYSDNEYITEKSKLTTPENEKTIDNMKYVYIPPPIEQPLPSTRDVSLKKNGELSTNITISTTEEETLLKNSLIEDTTTHFYSTGTTEEEEEFLIEIDDEGNFRGDIPGY